MSSSSVTLGLGFRAFSLSATLARVSQSKTVSSLGRRVWPSTPPNIAHAFWPLRVCHVAAPCAQSAPFGNKPFRTHLISVKSNTTISESVTPSRPLPPQIISSSSMQTPACISRGSGAWPVTRGRSHFSRPSRTFKTWMSPIGPWSGLEPPCTTMHVSFRNAHATCAFRGGGDPVSASANRRHSQFCVESTTTSLKHVPLTGSMPPKTYISDPIVVAEWPDRPAGKVSPFREVVVCRIHRAVNGCRPSKRSTHTSSSAFGDRSAPPMNTKSLPHTALAHPPRPAGEGPTRVG